MLWWGIDTLSGGTTTPRVVPTWTQPSSSRVSAGTGASGVHRRHEGDASPGHRHKEGGATAIFFQRLVKWGWSPPWAPLP